MLFTPCHAGPDDMPAHIKSSVFGCALSYVLLTYPDQWYPLCVFQKLFIFTNNLLL